MRNSSLCRLDCLCIFCIFSTRSEIISSHCSHTLYSAIMKKITVVLLLLITFYGAKSQDTLHSNDFTAAGDTFVLSIGTSFSGINPAATGANFIWDYAALGRSSQRVDTVFNPSSTNALLGFFFINSQFNSNRSNQAMRGQNFNLGFVGLSDVFNYYYNSTTDFSQPGFGAVVNGIPIPVAYTPHDIIYRFPLKYADEDSVTYNYQLDLTSTLGLFYSVARKRHNLVDGWGSVTTPYGTYNVLRVKSTIVEQDSVYIDSLGFGIKTPPITTFEYKWLGAGYGLPLLQINTTSGNIITQILYQDSIHTTGIENVQSIISEPVVFPNPSSEFILIRYSLLQKSNVVISLYSVDGKEIIREVDNNQQAGEAIRKINFTGRTISRGIYLLTIEAGHSKFTKQIEIQ